MPTPTSPRSLSEETLCPIQFRVEYLKSQFGILKLIGMVCNVLGYICVEVSRSSGREYYSFVVTSSLWITGILIFLHSTNISSFIQDTLLTLLELIFCAFWTVLYALAVIWCLIFGSGVAAFFAFYAILAYGLYGWLKFLPYVNNNAQEADEIIVC